MPACHTVQKEADLRLRVAAQLSASLPSCFCTRTRLVKIKHAHCSRQLSNIHIQYEDGHPISPQTSSRLCSCVWRIRYLMTLATMLTKYSGSHKLRQIVRRPQNWGRPYLRGHGNSACFQLYAISRRMRVLVAALLYDLAVSSLET
jgi:hypothetical protein